MGSQQELPVDWHNPHGREMKFLILLTLVTVVLGDYDKKMINQWQSMKAIESCWGEENMKKLTVNMKRAIATCSEQDGVGAVRLDGEDDVVPAGAGTEVREQWSSSQHEAVLLRLSD